MSVKSTKTVLTIFKENKSQDFFKDLVYSKIKFEVLNPIELGSQWSQVEFVKNSDSDKGELLHKTDKILQNHQPKGFLNSFVDHRPEVDPDEIHFIDSHAEKAKYFEIINKLGQYDLYQDSLLELDQILNENPNKEILIGQNIANFKDKLDSFSEQVLAEFAQNHPSIELEDQTHQLDLIALTGFEAILFEPADLEYILDYHKSTHSHITLFKADEFLEHIAKQEEILTQDLQEFSINPSELSKENYLLICSIYANLELENILLEASSKVFHLSSDKVDQNTSYAFISVHPDHLDNFNQILAQNKITSEPTSWSKEIVAWNQNSSITPFKNVAQSLGTISSNEFDPSFIITIFFSLFFAFCLGDAFYGLILVLFTGYFLFFKKLKVQFENIFQLFFISGLATIIFGALFNSWAGDLFAKTPLNPLFESAQLINSLDPLSKAPVNQLLLERGISPIVALLGFSVGLGFINLLVGYIIKIINSHKAGDKKALAEDLNWFLFVVFGFAMFFNGVLPSIVGTLITAFFVLSGLAFFVTNGGKNISGKILGGLAKFYNLIGFGSDLLSFTRLIAVGLTGGIIASVINLLAFLIYDAIPVPVLNVVVMLVVLIVGHLFNLIISLFGAYINPLRLHYVEFLPKFYEPSGQKLNFINTDFKYLKVKN